MSALCATHREVAAVATCGRCGSFLCEACVVIRDEESLCADCSAKLAAQSASFAAMGAAVVAVVSGAASYGTALTLIRSCPTGTVATIAVAAVAAISAFAVALRERARIRRGESTRAGRGWALVALIVAPFATLPLILALFVSLELFWRR